MTWPETLSATTNPRWSTARCRPKGPSSRAVMVLAAGRASAADAVGTTVTAPVAATASASETAPALVRDFIWFLP